MPGITCDKLKCFKILQGVAEEKLVKLVEAIIRKSTSIKESLGSENDGDPAKIFVKNIF